MKSLHGKKSLITAFILLSASFVNAQEALTSHVASAATPAVKPDASLTVTTGGGTANYIPQFTGASTIGDSIIYATGNSVGIGDVPNPGAKLDVNGSMIMRGPMTVSRTGNATTAKGFPSYGFDFYSSTYNSSTHALGNPYFQLQSEPTGNNTTTPSSTFNLLYANGGALAETGFYINPNGTVHFASAQTFPITQGPPGPTGPQGPAGPAGPQGPAGSLTLPFSGSGNSGGNSNYLFKLTDNDSNGGGAIYATGGSSNDADFPSKPGITGVGGNSTDTQATEAGDGISGIGGNGVGPLTYGGAGGRFLGGNMVTGGNDAGNGVQATGGNGADPGTGGWGLIATPGSNGQYAAYFEGDVHVAGNLSKSGGSFKIDDPVDPEDKYLYHSFVESPDMMNVYNGNTITDSSGAATVVLPSYFETLNRDFRYQLTVLGQFAQAIVGSKIANNQFVIRTDKPGVEVSWQVTGIRQDAWANAHRIPVEEEKAEKDKGKYLNPELFGKSREASISAIHRSVTPN